MMLKGLTAEYLLFRSYPVKPGDVVLVHAAAGGVGLRALGATVIGTAGSAEKAAWRARRALTPSFSIAKRILSCG